MTVLYQYKVTLCVVVVYQLDEVDRVIFCMVGEVDPRCYSVEMPKYFPLPADAFSTTTRNIFIYVAAKATYIRLLFSKMGVFRP